jgi:predicted transcriptional regulator
MEMIPITSERKAELERFARERGKTLGDTVDDALATYLEWERQDQEEAVEGVARAYEDVKAGRTRPAQEFLDELRAKHGLPR